MPVDPGYHVTRTSFGCVWVLFFFQEMLRRQHGVKSLVHQRSWQYVLSGFFLRHLLSGTERCFRHKTQAKACFVSICLPSLLSPICQYITSVTRVPSMILHTAYALCIYIKQIYLYMYMQIDYFAHD